MGIQGEYIMLLRHSLWHYGRFINPVDVFAWIPSWSAKIEACSSTGSFRLPATLLTPNLSQMLQSTAKRPTTSRSVDNITHAFYDDWLSELTSVKEGFEAARSSTTESLYFPSSVALAYQIIGLRQRLSSLLDEHKVHQICFLLTQRVV